MAKVCIVLIILSGLSRRTLLGNGNGMPKSLKAIAKLLRARRIQFLELTGTGVGDIDGHITALEEASLCSSE